MKKSSDVTVLRYISRFSVAPPPPPPPPPPRLEPRGGEEEAALGDPGWCLFAATRFCSAFDSPSEGMFVVTTTLKQYVVAGRRSRAVWTHSSCLPALAPDATWMTLNRFEGPSARRQKTVVRTWRPYISSSPTTLGHRMMIVLDDRRTSDGAPITLGIGPSGRDLRM